MTGATDLASTASASTGHRRLTVLSGPSGVGKSTVVRALRSSHPELWVSVSVTTRFPRPGEVDGIHYHFVTEERFDELIGEGALLEWAEFSGHRYGTPLAPVEQRLAAGHAVLLEIELQGARQVRQKMPDALLVFLAPPTWEELVARLTKRRTEPPEVIERRLATARAELAAEPEFDVTLINSNVQDVVAQLIKLLEF